MKFLGVVIVFCLMMSCKKADPLPELLVPCYSGLSSSKIVKYSWFDGVNIVRSVFQYDSKGRKVLDSVIYKDPPIVQRRITYTSDTSAIDAALNQPLGFYTLNQQGFPISYLRPGKHLDSTVIATDGKILESIFIIFSKATNIVDNFVYDGNGNIISAHAVYDEPSTSTHLEGDFAFEYVTGKLYDVENDPLGRSLDPLVPQFQLYCKNLIRKVKMPYALTYTGHDEITYDYLYNDLGYVSVVTATKREYEFDVTLRPGGTTTQTKILYYNCAE